VLGPTASGKTRMACLFAYELNGEIINADSRQVYKQLDIGAGKDLNEYKINGESIPYHLINVAEPQEQFYLHDFITALDNTFKDLVSRGKLPIICGGTGLYLDAIHKDFSLTQIPEDHELRNSLGQKTKAELLQLLESYPQSLTAHVDRNSVKRIVRGIEIAEYRQKNPLSNPVARPDFRPYYIGIQTDKDQRNERIGQRLRQRLNAGLIEEVQGLLNSGVSAQRLDELGLEYRFVLKFLQGEFNRDELAVKLETAIRQFAKRQMTWFRKMEKEGVQIRWVTSAEEILPELKEIFR